MIQSVLDGDVIPEKFYLALCREGYHHMDEGLSEIPAEVRPFVERSELEILWSDKNHGPFTKISPVMKLYWDKLDQIIVTADDDTVYPSWWLSRL